MGTASFPPWPIEGSLGQRFVAQAMHHGDRPAVIEPERVTSYAALERWSRCIATALSGAAPGEPVGVMVEQGAAQIAAIFGVLRAGALYVSLDVALPIARLRTIIDDAGLRTVIADRANRSLAQWLVPDGRILEPTETSAAAESVDVGADAPAYIYYTSGSTGPAKGVVDSHRNVMHNVARYSHALRIHHDDRLTLLQSCGFSGAVSNIFGALLNGAALLPFDVRRHGVTALARWLAAASPTVYHSVPSLFRQVIDTGIGLPTLRVIRIEGDLGGTPDVERFRRHFNQPGQPRCVLAHGLGATETGLVAQYFVAPETNAGPLPVGHALPDTQIAIVHGDGSPAARGQIGEIAITSRYLATGYWRRPELTAARFTHTADGARCYRTGDLGRIAETGALEVHGRADLLVRIHGEWVDLHALERTLRAQPGVRDAIVTSFEGPSGRPALRAHVIASADVPVLIEALRQALPALPGLPIEVRHVEHWPLDANGKVDRRALAIALHTTDAHDGAAPATPTEQIVAEVFAAALHVARVSRDDDFFELGGDSLQAVEASLALEQRLGHGRALGAFQHASTVRGLASLLDDATPADDLVVLQPSGDATPLVCIHGHGGNVFSLRTLARWFGPERPVFGLQMRGLGGVGLPPGSIEQAAASHVASLRRAQPHGPYQLAGNCFGSWVAIEMARQLVAAGEKVAALMLINPDLPTGYRSLTSRARDAVRALRRRAPSTGLSAAVMTMKRRYRPTPVFVPTALLVPSDRPLDGASHQGWHRLARAGYEVVNIVGTTTDLFRMPQVRDLGACIAARLVP